MANKIVLGNVKGKDGKSAYQTAVENGYIGSEEDFGNLLKNAVSNQNLYVEFFGAVGDGVTDDTNAIQAAIDYLSGTGGGSISFAPGKRYKIAKMISIKANVSVFGNGAKILSYVESGPFLYVRGSLGPEITLAADVSTTRGDDSAVTISTAERHNFATGDRIILQSQRDALAEESGAFWCGTPTSNALTCHYAEVLTVHTVPSENELVCTGSLIYPYYLASREEGVDVSTQQTQREHSTVRAANFLRGIVIRDLTFECYGQGKTHADNTMVLQLCEGAIISRVRVVKHGGHGRCFMMVNCLHGVFDNCVADASDTVYADYMESHAIDNHFTFSSSWFCVADGCESYHAGQTFDATYASQFDGMEEYVRCPCISPVVQNCMTHGAIDSAATNHSGCYGCVYANSRFTNFARPMSVRSPNTLIYGCTFTANRTDNAGGSDGSCAIIVSDPTTFGTRIENCIISSDEGIEIRPAVSTLEYAPKRKRKGIAIVGNVFSGVRNRLIYISSSNTGWNYENGDSEAGAYTQYAKDPLDVLISGNTFLKCGGADATILIYMSALTNGVTISRNRFIDCVSPKSFIGQATPNINIAITENRFSGCSAGQYAYNYYSTLSMDDPRNSTLDANYLTRNVYADNVSLDDDFLVCNAIAGTIDRRRTNTKNCGSLYSNKDSDTDGYAGWWGDLTAGDAKFYITLNGSSAYMAAKRDLSPTTDGDKALGSASDRWADVYTATGAINTSDQTEKTEIAPVTDDVLDAWGGVNYRQFRFNDAVSLKGAEARIHVGLVAQDVQDAFAAVGLDASRYGLFCADEVTLEDGTMKTRYGIRYSEALALECAYLRSELNKIKSRLYL